MFAEMRGFFCFHVSCQFNTLRQSAPFNVSDDGKPRRRLLSLSNSKSEH